MGRLDCVVYTVSKTLQDYYHHRCKRGYFYFASMLMEGPPLPIYCQLMILRRLMSYQNGNFCCLWECHYLPWHVEMECPLLQ